MAGNRENNERLAGQGSDAWAGSPLSGALLDGGGMLRTWLATVRRLDVCSSTVKLARSPILGQSCFCFNFTLAATAMRLMRGTKKAAQPVDGRSGCVAWLRRVTSQESRVKSE